jgi:type I restriction enzyme S subunit
MKYLKELNKMEVKQSDTLRCPEPVEGSLPKGYKNTEIGVIPVDWDYIKFGELFSEFRGGAPLAPTDFTNEGMHVIPKSGVTRGGYLKIEPNKQQFCSNEFAIAHKSSWVDKSHTIIVLRDLVPSGPNIGLIVSIQNDLDYILAQGVYGFKVFKEKVEPNFLIHLSNTDEYRKLMKSILVGSTQVHIRNSTLKETQIPLPPLPEQAAIATVLSDTDNLIQALEKKIAKKQLIKKGAMQKLLSSTSSDTGKPKEGWEVKTLGEIADVRDGTHQTPTYVETGVPFFSVESITNNDFKNTKYITKEAHKLLTKTFRIEKGDILMTRIGSIGDCKFVDWEVNASFYVSLALLKIKSGYSSNYICHYSKTSSFKKETDINSLQSAIPRKINLGPISNIKIEMPDYKEQTRIATILSDMDNEIETLEKKLAKYKQIKQGLMQNLLTGKIRLDH